MAQLHAVTSLIYRDPFTAMTGTEQAIHILNLKLCKGMNPYNDASKYRLDKIAKLSPKRSFIPSHLRDSESIIWPEFLPAQAASDSFVILVNTLVDESSLLKTTLKESAISHKPHIS